MHYVSVDANGLLTFPGFADDTIAPPPAGAIPLTDDQWQAWVVNQQSYCIVNGIVTYVAPVVPPPDPVALSQAALAVRIALGIEITSDSTPAVNGTYALDSVSTGQIFQIGVITKQFGTFPSGSFTQMYPDISGTLHEFPTTVFISFFLVVAAYTSALNVQQVVMAQGGSPAWPASTYDIP